MATAAQTAAGRVGGVVGARPVYSQMLPLVMVAGATVSGSIAVPEGSQLHSIKLETPTAISGAPTNINVRVGSAAAGQQVVADVDAKAQGHIAATIVAAFDAMAGVVTYFFQAAATGGTAPAGTINAILTYSPPVR